MAITTAEELLRAGDIGRCELIRGELRMMIPAGDEHGRIIVGLTCAVANHVMARKLGLFQGAETGFILSSDPDTVRAPDLAKAVVLFRDDAPGGAHYQIIETPAAFK